MWHKCATFLPPWHSAQIPKSGTNVPLFNNFWPPNFPLFGQVTTVNKIPKVAQLCHFLTLFGHFDKVYKFPKVAQTCHFCGQFTTVYKIPRVAQLCHFFTLFGYFDKVYKFPKVEQTCHFLTPWQSVKVPRSDTNVPLFCQFTLEYKIPKVAQMGKGAKCRKWWNVSFFLLFSP